MNFRPRPGLGLAVAAALAGAAPLASSPAGADEPLVEHCYTEVLTAEQVEAGEVSQVDCWEAFADEPVMAMRTGVTYAIAYDIDPTTGPVLVIGDPTATSCTGGFVVFGTGHPWDNAISSTELVACGSAKHYASTTLSGTPNQLLTGSGTLHSLTGTMNNATSSIQYA